MVELRLESTDANVPQDCYVSVRVGETQKLSKLNGTRTYRFPSVADMRLGKIEVFKRVGECSIDVDPANSGAREVHISCGADLGALGLRVQTEADTATKQQLQEEMATKRGTKMKAAKDYLSKHGLESLLSDAMSAVLRERPEKPVDFLVERLRQGKPFAAVSKPVQQSTAPATQPAKKPTPAPATKLGERGYYSSHVLPTCGAGAFASLYSQFPQPDKAAPAKPAKAAAPATKLGDKDYYVNNVLPNSSDAAWSSLYSLFPAANKNSTSASAAKSIQGGTYYSNNVLPGVSSGALDSLYSQFPAPKKPEVASAASTAPAPAPAANAAPAPALLNPSVGTWMQRPRRMPGPINSVMPSPFSGPKSAPAAAHAASAPAAAHAASAPAASGKSAASPSPASPGASGRGAPAPAAYLAPSVGTWLAGAPLMPRLI